MLWRLQSVLIQECEYSVLSLDYFKNREWGKINSNLSVSIGWAVYLLASEYGWNLVWANYAATVCVALTAQILARRKFVPATVFLIPGIIPLVPGGGMYLIVWCMLYDTPAATSAYFYETLQMAGAIALGIFTVDTAFRIPKKRKQQIH